MTLFLDLMAGATITSTVIGAPSIAWTNPGNAVGAANGVYATCVLAAETSRYLESHLFDFAGQLPPGAINITIQPFWIGHINASLDNFNVVISRKQDGSTDASTKSTANVGTTDAEFSVTVPYSTAALATQGWDAASLIAGDFAILGRQSTSSTQTWSVDTCGLHITYDLSPAIASAGRMGERRRGTKQPITQRSVRYYRWKQGPQSLLVPA